MSLDTGTAVPMIGAMQHVAKVLACLDPDGASPEEWDELLHAQAITLAAERPMLCDVGVEFVPLFSRSMDPNESMERAVMLGVMPQEFLENARHFFNTGEEPLCSCKTFLSDDIVRHEMSCKLLTYSMRPTYVMGRGLLTESQVFSFLMRMPEILAANARCYANSRIVWCPRDATSPFRDRFDGNLWLRDLGERAIAIGVPVARFSSYDPGPYTAQEIAGRAALEAREAFLTAPTFA